MNENIDILNEIGSCLYSLDDELPLSEGNLNIIHLNIRSVATNLDEFLVNLRKFQGVFHIIVLTETWLDQISDWTELRGYKSFHTIRTGRKGGGVSILVNERISCTELSELSLVSAEYESICVKVSSGSYSYHIFGVYRPPSCNLSVFNAVFFPIVRNLGTNNSCVVVGDFNVDSLSQSASGPMEEFLDLFSVELFSQLIDIPTRVSNTCSTCLDHIYINFPIHCLSGVLDVTVSDHLPIFCSIPSFFQRESNIQKVRFRDYSDDNILLFTNNLYNELENFHVFDNFDIDDKFDILNKVIIKLHNRFFPILSKNISAKRLNSPWINDNLLSCIKEKYRLYKLSRQNPAMLSRYKSYSSSLRKTLASAKKSYYQNKFAYCSDQKSSWKLINGILNPNKSVIKYKLVKDDIPIVEPDLIANEFNAYFTNIASNLLEKVPVTSSNPCQYVPSHQNSFVFFPTTADEVSSTISQFKSKRGRIMDVPSFIFKSVSDVISPLLSKLFNESVILGIFPRCFKVARVIPIY